MRKRVNKWKSKKRNFKVPYEFALVSNTKEGGKKYHNFEENTIVRILNGSYILEQLKKGFDDILVECRKINTEDLQYIYLRDLRRC